MKKPQATTEDIVHDLSFKPQRRMEMFRAMPLAKQAELIHLLSKKVQKDLLLSLEDDELISLLEKVDPDEATDLLQLFLPRKRERIMQKLNENLKDTLSKLLTFDPDTAAGLMTLDYIQVSPEDKIEKVAERVRIHEKRTGREPVMLVVSSGRLIGTLSNHRLAFAAPSDHVQRYAQRIPVISHSANHKDVITLFKTRPHDKVVVINDDKSVMGIIYSDDVLQLMHEQESSSLYDFAGISDEETVFDSARRKVKFRYKWLILNLGTAFLAAFTISLFESTISKYVLLAVYMPIVAGMGGNAGTQTLAVVVRGIALRQISLRTAGRTLRSELGAGFTNGIINGIIVAIVVIVLNRDPQIALVLALAMVVNLVVAGFFGTTIPLIMTRLGKDPAASATVFITTATDVLGFLTFLGLAQLIMS